MNSSQYTDLLSAIEDDRFVEVDLALRRGRHVDRQDEDWYAYLLEAQAALESFYRRYGCELVHRSDGYFFLLPTTEQLPRRQLSLPDMLVGQAVALLYLEPTSVESGGVVTRETVLAHLATVLGSEALMRAFNPKKRRIDERVAQQTVRTKVGEALRRLATLGFVELLEGEQLRLRPALMRFAEPVRNADSPAAALARLLASGEVVLEDEHPQPAGEDAEESEANGDGADEAEIGDDASELEVHEGEASDDVQPSEDEGQLQARGVDAGALYVEEAARVEPDATAVELDEDTDTQAVFDARQSHASEDFERQ